MYLVYLTVGHDPFFAILVELCVNSILATTDNSKIDICIMCSSDYQQYVSHLPVKIHLTGWTESAMLSSMRKLEVFNVQNIFDYERVLFLDGDIIVQKSLIPLFEAVTDSSKLYIFNEYYKGQHNHIY
jgi:alpha-N-acetylglucosamine transferase